MTLSKRVKRNESISTEIITEYEVIRCMECGHIYVTKETFLRRTIKESPEHYIEQVLPGFLEFLQYPRTSSYDCVDGICENCIKKKNITVIFDKDNPISRYTKSYNRFNRKFDYRDHIITDYRLELQRLKKEVSKEILCAISADAYNNIILGSNPETAEAKEKLAKKYVESAKDDLINYLKVRTRERIMRRDNRSYIDSKKALKEKADEAIEFLQNSGSRVYRCKKTSFRDYASGKRTWSCPFFPKAIVSNRDYYEIEESWDSESTIHKIAEPITEQLKEQKYTDRFPGYDDIVAELLSTLPHMIAKADVWG